MDEPESNYMYDVADCTGGCGRRVLVAKTATIQPKCERCWRTYIAVTGTSGTPSR